LLIAALLILGIWPRLLTDKIRPSAEVLLSHLPRQQPTPAAELAEMKP
jgi:hypothetical protein